MSRVGKQPVIIPSGVKVSVQSGVVLIEGPKGKLSFTPAKEIGVTVADGKIVVAPIVSAGENGEKIAKTPTKGEIIPTDVKAKYGTARATINNMVLGVTKPWKRVLELNGVGFTAKIQGQKLTLAVGFSHDVVVDVPLEVKCTVTKNQIELESVDRQLVGTLAANIRKVQPPEPYLGKGIKYLEEKVRRKAGKTGKK